jgi:hypothetical protein
MWVNGLGYGEFGRTVDYTDLLALSVLPVCRSIAGAADSISFPWKRLRAILAAPICATTFFAILGTSQIPPRQENFLIRDSSSARLFEREAVASVIKAVAEKHGMSCRNCDTPADSYFDGDGFGMRYEFTGLNTATFSIWIHTSCALILWFCGSASNIKKAEALRASLKQELGIRFRTLSTSNDFLPPVGSHVD